MTQMPTDLAGNPIPVARLRVGGAHNISSGVASARNAVAFDAGIKVVSFFATEDVYVAFGDVAVVATTSDHFFPKGVYYDFSIGVNALHSSGGTNQQQYTHVAVLRVVADGEVYVSEKE